MADRILVVDDDENLLRSIKKVLKLENLLPKVGMSPQVMNGIRWKLI